MQFTIQQLDAMDEDQVLQLAQEGRGTVLESSDAQRAAMASAHVAWVTTLDPDLRDEVDWSIETRDNWDLYAELRINGVAFARVAEPRMGM